LLAITESKKELIFSNYIKAIDIIDQANFKNDNLKYYKDIILGISYSYKDNNFTKYTYYYDNYINEIENINNEDINICYRYFFLKKIYDSNIYKICDLKNNPYKDIERNEVIANYFLTNIEL